MANRIEGVEIFAVGTWNEMKFTAEDLGDIAGNTAALMASSNHRVPLKLGHDIEQPLLGEEGELALGWVENLRVVGDKLVADFAGVPGVVMEVIGAELLRTVSVEMKHLEEFGWVLTAVALLGAELPAVKSIDDLQAYLSARNQAGHPGDGEALEKRLTFSEPQFLGEATMPDKLNDAERQELDRLRASETKKTGADQEELDRLRASEAEFKAGQGNLEAENKKLKAEAAERAFAEAKTKALEPFEAQVKAGSMTPALRDELAAALDGQAATFSEGGALSVPLELMAKFSGATLPAGESARGDDGSGAGASTATDRVDVALDKEVRAAMKENPKLEYSEAADVVFRENPELAQRFVAETGDPAKPNG